MQRHLIAINIPASTGVKGKTIPIAGTKRNHIKQWIIDCKLTSKNASKLHEKDIQPSPESTIWCTFDQIAV